MNLQSIKRVLINLYHEMAPPVLFFFIAFMLIGVMFKLFVTQYSIQFTAFTRAAVFALIIGKVILLIDWAESGRDFGSHRRIVVIACQTFVYAFAVFTLGIGERILEAAHKAHSLREGFDMVIANAQSRSLHRPGDSHQHGGFRLPGVAGNPTRDGQRRTVPAAVQTSRPDLRRQSATDYVIARQTVTILVLFVLIHLTAGYQNWKGDLKRRWTRR